MRLGLLFLCDAPHCVAEISTERGTCSAACREALTAYDADIADLNRTLATRRDARFEADEARRQGWLAASVPAGIGSQGAARRIR